ncbi:hypothetical protein BDQ17DRAFT_1331197 [Cyathus striatus]|nr:hypothetical protein BDQ17DRAFT_1331197 [Cyathus striatus]
MFFSYWLLPAFDVDIDVHTPQNEPAWVGWIHVKGRSKENKSQENEDMKKPRADGGEAETKRMEKETKREELTVPRKTVYAIGVLKGMWSSVGKGEQGEYEGGGGRKRWGWK